MSQTALFDEELLDEGDALDEFEADAFADEYADFYDPPPPAGPGGGLTQVRRPPRRRRRSTPGPRPRGTGAPGTTPRRAPATLADLQTFSRAYVRNMIARRRAIDCADLAIEIWIRFAERHNLPVSFRVWDSTGRRWMTATRAGVRAGGAVVRRFPSYDAFIRWTQSNLGAAGLSSNTFAVRGRHRSAVAGDVFLWQWRNNRTGRLASVGHTQILDRVVRGSSGDMSDTITVFQGNLPPVVPQKRRRPASFFYNRRTANLSAGPHTGIPVGPGPRRFNSFRSLR